MKKTAVAIMAVFLFFSSVFSDTMNASARPATATAAAYPHMVTPPAKPILTEADIFYGQEPGYDTDESFYFSVTRSADYRIKPVFEKVEYKKNNLVTDIKVNLIETIPFGFTLGYIGIWSYQAIKDRTISPKLDKIEKYTPQLLYTIGGLALLTATVNFVWYYDYKENGADAQKSAEKTKD